MTCGYPRSTRTLDVFSLIDPGQEFTGFRPRYRPPGLHNTHGQTSGPCSEVEDPGVKGIDTSPVPNLPLLCSLPCAHCTNRTGYDWHPRHHKPHVSGPVETRTRRVDPRVVGEWVRDRVGPVSTKVVQSLSHETRDALVAPVEKERLVERWVESRPGPPGRVVETDEAAAQPGSRRVVTVAQSAVGTR